MSFAARAVWSLRSRFARWQAVRRGATLHPTVFLHPEAIIHDPALLTIGAGSRTSACTFVTHSGYDRIAIRKLGHWVSTRRPIVIGADCFIGWQAVVLSGAVIGDDCIVAAGAVVRGVVPSGSIVAGNPARVVGLTADYLARVERGDTPPPLTNRVVRAA